MRWDVWWVVQSTGHVADFFRLRVDIWEGGTSDLPIQLGIFGDISEIDILFRRKMGEYVFEGGGHLSSTVLPGGDLRAECPPRRGPTHLFFA